VFLTHHDEWGGSCLFTGGAHVRVPHAQGEATDHVPFWFKPVSIFGLLYFTMSAAVHMC